MMDRRDALLVERLKRRTRDPDVLTLCEYVHGTDVHGTIPHDTRALQAWLGHKNIQHTVRYTELSSGRFKDFWR
jgi:hypothetical protein